MLAGPLEPFPSPSVRIRPHRIRKQMGRQGQYGLCLPPSPNHGAHRKEDEHGRRPEGHHPRVGEFAGSRACAPTPGAAAVPPQLPGAAGCPARKESSPRPHGLLCLTPGCSRVCGKPPRAVPARVEPVQIKLWTTSTASCQRLSGLPGFSVRSSKSPCHG
jgi:hypothetical protein